MIIFYQTSLQWIYNKQILNRGLESIGHDTADVPLYRVFPHIWPKVAMTYEFRSYIGYFGQINNIIYRITTIKFFSHNDYHVPCILFFETTY